jgi:hypothetical protein
MIYPCPKGSKENERNTDKAPFRAGGDFEFRIFNSCLPSGRYNF